MKNGKDFSMSYSSLTNIQDKKKQKKKEKMSFLNKRQFSKVWGQLT